jgi:hypothetical protein
MLEWLKKLLPSPPREESAPPPTADEAFARLQTMASDAVVEDVWDGMDLHGDELEPRVRAHLLDGTLGPYPAHAATIWLAYRRGNAGRTADEEVLERLRESITWALQFEENNVLIGGALGALDAVPSPRREEMALTVFEELGDDSARRYWLLLKVRSDAMMKAVTRALRAYRPALRPKMAGAFRQFGPEDVDVLLRHYEPDSAGAAMFVEALGATRSPKVLDALREAADDTRPEVAEAAERGLRQMEG